METIQFWKDRERKTIEPSLFSERAEDFAKVIASECVRNGKLNKRTQIRKFYDEVLHLTSEAKRSPHQWDDILPLVNMVVAKAAYAKGRSLVSDSFLGFIRDSVTQVESVEDLNLFANFFEAFMGFYRLHGPSN